MIKIAAFDLDGTIADTMPLCMEAFCESVSQYVGHELTEKEVVAAFGLNEIGMVKAVVEEREKQEPAIRDFYARYELLHREVTEPFPGILDLFTFLKEKNMILALITGKGEKSCMISLRNLGLSEMFDEIRYGSELAPNKTENIESLLEKYGVSKNEFCYVGDALQDIAACRAAGVVCYSAAWQESADPVVLEESNPNHVFCSVKGLHEYLERQVIRRTFCGQE